jgi:hypothetical protein
MDQDRIQSGALELFVSNWMRSRSAWLKREWLTAFLSNQREEPSRPFAAVAVWLFGFGRIRDCEIDDYQR